MNKLRFTSDIRLRPLLSIGAAVLLTACGGGSASGSAGVNQAPQDAAPAVNHAAASNDGNEASTTGDAPAEAAPSDASTTPGTSVSNFDIVGYEGDPAAPMPEAEAVSKTVSSYYVAPNGSDSNPGTPASPFKTILRASKAAVANTNIYVAPGTYPGGFMTTANGSSSGKINFISTTRWGAKIVPPASSSSSVAWDNRGNYVQVIGFEIDGTRPQNGTKWLHGIYFGGSYGVIKENHIHHIAEVVPCNGAGGAAIGVDSYYRGRQTDVIGNNVHDIGPAGCKYVQGIYLSTSGSLKNNVIYRVSEAAIHLWHDANNVIITNNTVAASDIGIVVGGGDFYYSSEGDDYTAVYNNIVYDNKYGISEQGKTGMHNTYRNNLVYQNAYNWSLKNGLSHSSTVSAAPLFVSYDRTSGTPNFHLSSSSPAIGRGTATNALPTDFDGKPRNDKTGFDIGAYQH